MLQKGSQDMDSFNHTMEEGSKLVPVGHPQLSGKALQVYTFEILKKRGTWTWTITNNQAKQEEKQDFAMDSRKAWIGQND
jgi:hypothetical protein